MLSTLLGAKLGATLAGVAVALGGTAVVAYTSSLPTGAQNLAHASIEAPAASFTDTPSPAPTGSPSPAPTGSPSPAPTGSPSPVPTGSPTSHPTGIGTPVGPDATGAATFGLCTAWTHQQTNGANTHGKSQESAASKNLARAAGGADNIAAYCATTPSPGNTSHPTGKPSTLPTPSSTSHPTGKPSTLPTPGSTRRG